MVSHACMLIVHCAFMLFFLKDTAPTEISPLSLHAALPILVLADEPTGNLDPVNASQGLELFRLQDRKSTRLNSSHRCISYAVFCFTKNNKACLTTTGGSFSIRCVSVSHRQV